MLSARRLKEIAELTTEQSMADQSQSSEDRRLAIIELLEDRGQAPDRYFYHSFPRPLPGVDEIAKGLRILESIAEKGLLLTPENTKWRERLSNGELSPPWPLMQQSASFTDIAPSELQQHSIKFGHFALEFDVEAIRQLGGIPVFYLPRASKDDIGMESLASMLMCRMGEIQRVLNHLAKLEDSIRQSNDKTQPLTAKIGGQEQVLSPSLEDAETVLAILTQGSEAHPYQSPSTLRNAFKGLSGFFYPAERYPDDLLLQYYRQREWRIVADMYKDGKKVTMDLSDDEKKALLELDEEFYSREIEYPSGSHQRVYGCEFLRELEGRTFLNYARRVIVPDEVVDQAKQILTGDRLPEVVPASDV